MNIETLEEFDPSVPTILPHEKVYSIQVGYKLFKLSGLSLSSDAPSYFTKYFNEPDNEHKVLFFDRNPTIFEKIYNHLQGYSIDVKDDYEFVHLWSDCFYFGLNRLQKILTEQDIFANIGGVSFKIPQSLFINTGNHPNYFSMNNERSLLDNFQIIEQKNMLRPPPQKPSSVPNRSPQLFADLLELLRGNHLIIKNDQHRQLLIKECRYYRFMELEQRILNHRIEISSKGCPQIIMNLNDLTRKGVSNLSKDRNIELPIRYTRPYITKEITRNLVFQIDFEDDQKNSQVKLILNKSTKLALVKITNKFCNKIKQVFKDFLDGAIIDDTDKDNPSVSFFVGFSESKCTINGMEMKPNWVDTILDIKEPEENPDLEPLSKKRKTTVESLTGDMVEILLTRSMWRLMMRGNLCRLHAVTIEGYSDYSKVPKTGFL
ncbi:uncharacterized protein J8A68_002036 [[Candida] subhashii]|uniref:BTB domain-containing protein n=1 Tax=[Candida] subhashii TaxID=561895 RepID=A0A8J5QQ72_9ASCO|nr:uncharacterized protein J8A68_002036 [[Candida] subhashii]KAG7664433.1 hypothetical protein J8A68_002036 [[Candida] subhashii]